MKMTDEGDPLPGCSKSRESMKANLSKKKDKDCIVF